MTDAQARFLDDVATVGITDVDVLAALARVDRRRFLPDVPDDWVYDDGELPDGIHHSQPLTVARLCVLSGVGPGDRVLEVGTGSGYQTAVLAHLGAQRIVTIESDAYWAGLARPRLADLPVCVLTGDGRRGHPPGAPYDVVVVNAAAPAPPAALLDQVARGGRLVMPVGAAVEVQEWEVRERHLDGSWSRTTHGTVRFAPLE